MALAAERNGDYDAGDDTRGVPRRGRSGDEPDSVEASPDVGAAGTAGPDAPRLPQVFDRLEGAVEAAQQPDPNDLHEAVLADGVEALHRAEAGLAALKSRWVAACQRAKTHEAEGARDSTAWLKDRLQVSGREAKKTAERAKLMKYLPGTSASLAGGEIGTEHADIVSKAMNEGRLGTPEETEEALLDPAREQTPDQLRATVRRLEQAARADSLADRERRARANREASMWRDRDTGGWVLHARLGVLGGEGVKTGLEAFTQLDDADTAPADRRTPGQRRADALVAMANAALGAAEAPTIGGVRPHVSVTVDYDTLLERADRPAEAAFSGPISPQAARQLACDAGLARIITKGASQILDAGRTTQSWSAPQRRAILALHGGCRWPGCDVPGSWCIIHHLIWFSEGGRTDTGNGIPVCGRHHTFIHDLDWEVELDPDTLELTATRRAELAAKPCSLSRSPDGSYTATSQPTGLASRTSPGSDPTPSPTSGKADATTDSSTQSPGPRTQAHGTGDGSASRPDGPPRTTGSDPPCLPGF